MKSSNELIHQPIPGDNSQLHIDALHKSTSQNVQPDMSFRRDPAPLNQSEAPNPKSKMADWSEYEELMIFVYVKKFKCGWIRIAKKFENRHRIAVRNKFVNSLTRYKFGRHNAMFRNLILKRTVQDLGSGLCRGDSQSG